MTSVSSLLNEKGFVCEPLSSEHLLYDFDAGDSGEALTIWLNDHASAFHQENLCKVWILRPIDNETSVRGYFTLSSHNVSIDGIPRKDRVLDKSLSNQVHSLPTLPAQLLGKFALDRELQGGAFGRLLMATVFEKYLQAEQSIGCKFLLTETSEPKLVSYYKNTYAFRESSIRQGGLIALYLSTENIREILQKIFE